MANYTDGTVQVADNSIAVVGTGTAFRSNVKAGQLFTVAGLCRPYYVAEVVDDTHLNLSEAVDITGQPDSTFILSEQSYSILDSFTPSLSVPMIGKDDVNKQPRMARAMNTIDLGMGTVLGWQEMRDAGLL